MSAGKVGFGTGPDVDDEDDSPSSEPQVGGSSSAELTPVVNAMEFVSVVSHLHSLGALYVRVGECEATFAPRARARARAKRARKGK